MEHKFYNDELERLLKEKSDEFRMYPSKRVWHSIYNDLHPSRRWPSIAMSMLLVGFLMVTGYLNTNDINNPRPLTENIPAVEDQSNNKKIKPATAARSTGLQRTQVFSNFNTLNNEETEALAERNDLLLASAGAGYKVRISGGSFTEDQQNNNTGISNTGIQNDETTSNKIKARNNKKRSRTVIVPIENKIPETLIAENETDNLTDTESPEINKPGTASLLPEGTGNGAASETTDRKEAATKIAIPQNKNILSIEEKAWMENYLMYNKSTRGKWKDRMAFEFYVTPSVGYRKLNTNSEYDAGTTNSFAASPTPPTGNVNNDVSHKPALGLEAGAGVVYSLAKRLKLKAGFQVNYTNYGINADEINHPTLTTLLLNDLNTNYPYLSPKSTVISNSRGYQPITIHNKTYQVSVPVGVSLKLAETSKFDWYAGLSIQPSYVFGGKVNLLSYDRQHYVSEPSMLREWNLSTGIETYINYKLGGVTLQAGPQFRYQLLSTYDKKYTLTENLYNIGVKFGVLKNF